jgi:hypothetical protein
MKYRTFRNIALGVGLTAATGLGFVVSRVTGKDHNDHADSRPAQAVAPALPAAPAPPPPRPQLAEAPGNLRDVDRDALAVLQRPVSDKVKDASRGRPYKINAYSDDGRRWTRLKIDLQRDEEWDESWTIKPDGRIERKLTRADGSGHKAYRLVDGRDWQPMR